MYVMFVPCRSRYVVKVFNRSCYLVPVVHARSRSAPVPDHAPPKAGSRIDRVNGALERQCQTVARTVRPFCDDPDALSNCEFTNCGDNKKNRTHVVPNETIATILFDNSSLVDMFSFLQF